METDTSAASQHWHDRRVMVFHGKHDTHIETGEEYGTRTLIEIFSAEPVCLPKANSPSFVPSSYCEYDGRSHKVQAERGSFVALVGDIDKGNHSIDRIRALVERLAGGGAWLIYSSSSSTADDRHWRVIMALRDTLAFHDWRDAQTAFFDLMEMAGVEMDRALNRAGQPVFLQNVPSTHGETGVPLRGGDGKPLYYQWASSGVDRPGVDPFAGELGEEVTDLRRRLAEDEKLREQIRVEAARKRSMRASSGDESVVDAFNRENDLATLLTGYGYKQSPRNADDWRSPHQTGDTYATRIVDGKWISLSGSDAAAGLGAPHSAGCYGDAFDLFVHYEHSGQFNLAVAALHRERDGCERPIRKSSYEVPPRRDDGDPGWTEAPDGYDFAAARERAHARGAENADRYDPSTGGFHGDKPEPDPLPLADLATWAATSPSPKRFIVAGRIPAREVTMLTGDGGTNKSTFGHQLAVCRAAERAMLGIDTEPGASLYLTAEDDFERLHWCHQHICQAVGVRQEALIGKLHISSVRGITNNELATFDAEGRIRPTPAFWRLRAALVETEVSLLVLDNVAHLFAGNENDRSQVTAFVNLLYSLCLELDVTILLIAHRNKAGDSYSGSTAWLNAIRSQLVIERADVSVDPDGRTLSVGKANYARPGTTLDFRWHDFALVLEADLPPDTARELAETIRATADNKLFLACLAERNRQRRAVSESKNAQNYAPKAFEAMAESKGIGRDRLEKAMDRLYRISKIRRGKLWRDTTEGKDISGLGEVGKDLPETSDDFPETYPETSRKVHPEGSGNPQKTTGNSVPLYTTYREGAAPEGSAAPSDYEPDEILSAAGRAAAARAAARRAGEQAPDQHHGEIDG